MDGGTEPVGWSYLVYLPDSPIVLLGGAATLPEHRGRGIYSALVAKRLADARADGRTAAVIQAVRSTSRADRREARLPRDLFARVLRLGRRAASGDPDAAARGLAVRSCLPSGARHSWSGSGECISPCSGRVAGGSRSVVFASHAGEEREPPWWLNLECERLWYEAKKRDGAFAEYEKRILRRIAVVVLERL